LGTVFRKGLHLRRKKFEQKGGKSFFLARRSVVQSKVNGKCKSMIESTKNEKVSKSITRKGERESACGKL